MSSTPCTDAENLNLKRIDELRFVVFEMEPQTKADTYFLRVANDTTYAALVNHSSLGIVLYYEVKDPMVPQYVEMICSVHGITSQIGIEYGENGCGERVPLSYYKNIWLSKKDLDLFFDITKCPLVNQKNGVSTL